MELSKENLLNVHRKERKELQAKIQNLKHGIPKGDKKKKKEITAEIALLEAQLEEKHEKELENLQNPVPSESVGTSADHADITPTECNNDIDSPSAVQKISKAQKRRNKKTEKAKEREQAIAEQEVSNLTGSRNVELQKLNKILSERGLTVHEVPSDGDCLYKAIEHQLSTLNLEEKTVNQLRKETSEYMLSHKDDFLPFLTDPGSDDIMSEDQYMKYCEDVANKPIWGGQVEIQALSNVCKLPIEVVQADGPSVVTGENNATSKLVISYHRHMYGLGEHYNSVVVATEADENFDDKDVISK